MKEKAGNTEPQRTYRILFKTLCIRLQLLQQEQAFYQEMQLIFTLNPIKVLVLLVFSSHQRSNSGPNPEGPPCSCVLFSAAIGGGNMESDCAATSLGSAARDDEPTFFLGMIYATPITRFQGWKGTVVYNINRWCRP